MVDDVSHLHVLHVLQPLSIMEPGVAWGEITDQTRKESVLNNMREKFADIEGAVFAVAHGSPGLEIAEYAKQIDADLIVIPSHGHSGFAHLFLGSVAERVLRHAPCPVLVLRRNGVD